MLLKYAWIVQRFIYWFIFIVLIREFDFVKARIDQWDQIALHLTASRLRVIVMQ